MVNLNEQLRVVYGIYDFNAYVNLLSPLALSESIQLGDRALSWSRAEMAWQNLSDQLEDRALQYEMVVVRLKELFSGSGAKGITKKLTNWTENFLFIAEMAKTRSRELEMMRFAFAVLSERVVPSESVRVNRSKAAQLYSEFFRNWQAINVIEAEYEKYRMNNIAAMTGYYHKAAAVIKILTGEEDVLAEEEEILMGEEDVLAEEGGHIFLLDIGDNEYYSPYS